MAFRYAVVNKTRDIANIGMNELADRAMILDKEKGGWLIGAVAGGKKTDILGSHVYMRDAEGNEMYEAAAKQTYEPGGKGTGYVDAPIALAGKRRYVWFDKINVADGITLEGIDAADWTQGDGYGSITVCGNRCVLKGDASSATGPYTKANPGTLKDGGHIYDTIRIYLDPENTPDGNMFHIDYQINKKDGDFLAGMQIQAIKNADGIFLRYEQTADGPTITAAGWYEITMSFENYHEPTFEATPVGKIIGYNVDTINEIVAMLPKDETLFVTSLAEDQPVKDEEEPTEPTEPSGPDEVDPEPEVPDTGDGEEEVIEG